jgi:hypothetical protein
MIATISIINSYAGVAVRINTVMPQQGTGLRECRQLGMLAK